MFSSGNKPKTIIRPFWERLFTDRTSDYFLIVILIAGTLYLYTWGIGSYSLWDPWEPKYAQSMREMVEQGDFVTPYLHKRIRWTKPILFYWAMYIPMLIGGNNEFTARLPSAIAAVMGVVVVFFFLRKLRNRRTAMIGACILGTLPQYFYLARQAMPDMLFTLFLTAAMGFFALARFGQNHKKRFFVLFYASVALAFLTKGPLAGAITLGAIFIFWMIDIKSWRIFPLKTALSGFRDFVAAYHVGLGIIVFMIIAGPWYIFMLAKHGYAFIDHFVGFENIQRFSEPVREHHGIVTYYVKTLFHGMYPWTSMLPVGILFFFQGREDREEVKQRWYYLSWFLVIFLVFSLAGTKQQHYILPITPVVAVLVAMVWEPYFKEKPPFWIPLVFLTSIGFMLLPIRDFLVEGNKYIFDNFTNRRTIETVDVALFLKFLLISWTIAMLLALLWRRSRVVATLVILIAYGNGIFLCHNVIPKHEKSRTLKYYVEYYLKARSPDAQLFFYGKIRPSINYYYGRDLYEHWDKGEEKEMAFDAKDKPTYIIVENKYARRLRRHLRKRTPLRWYTISREHPRYDLISNEPKKRIGLIRPEKPKKIPPRNEAINLHRQVLSLRFVLQGLSNRIPVGTIL